MKKIEVKFVDKQTCDKSCLNAQEYSNASNNKGQVTAVLFLLLIAFSISAFAFGGDGFWGYYLAFALSIINAIVRYFAILVPQKRINLPNIGSEDEFPIYSILIALYDEATLLNNW